MGRGAENITMHRIDTNGGTITLHSLHGAVQSIELNPEHGGTLLIQIGPDWSAGELLELRVESSDSYVVDFSPVQFRMRLEISTPPDPDPGDYRFEANGAGQVAWYRFRFVDGRMEQLGPRAVLRD